MTSQAQTPIVCEICDSDTDVKFYCVTCSVVLCMKCKQGHSRIPRTKNDEVISLSEARQQNKSKPEVTLCNDHPTEEVSLFCEECDRFICGECISQNHRGHNLSTMKNKIGDKKDELTNLIKEIQNKKEVLKKALDTENNVHTMNKQCYDQIRTDISEHFGKIIEEFTSLRDEKFTELSTIQQEENERHLDACANIQSQSETLSTAIQSVQTGIDSENLFTMEKAKNDASILVQNVDVPIEPIKDDTKYKPGSINRTAVMPLFGDISSKRQRVRQHSYVIPRRNDVKKIVIKSTKQAVLKRKNIKIIVPIAQDKAWVAGDKDKNLTMINRDEGTPKKKKSVQLCDGDSYIIDAKRYNNDLLATCYEKHQVLRLSENGRAVTTFTDVSPYYPLGIYVTHVMDVLLCLISTFHGNEKDAKVVRLNCKGDIFQSIQHDDKGDLIYSWPSRVTSFRSGEVIVCDLGKHRRVTCVNSEGQRMFTWNWEVDGRKMDTFEPRCLTYDKYSNLFITDINNYKVWVLSKDGKEAKCLIDMTRGIQKPWGIALDDHGQLWVGYNGGKIDIHTIEY